MIHSRFVAANDVSVIRLMKVYDETVSDTSSSPAYLAYDVTGQSAPVVPVVVMPTSGVVYLCAPGHWVPPPQPPAAVAVTGPLAAADYELRAPAVTPAWPPQSTLSAAAAAAAHVSDRAYVLTDWATSCISEK